ncbi:hypothetical protein FXO38_02604 [Capsicum annuum]|nr:hypothetical protein FXO38_02604 [Capsicum annuum]
MKELSSDHSQDLQSPLLKSNSLSNIDLVARNLLLLAYDPMENSDCAEEKITREDDNLKKDGEFILPPNEKGEKDEDEQPLIWKVKKLKDNKGKEKLIGSDISMRRLQNESRDTRHSQGVLSDGAIDVSSKNIGLGSSIPSAYRRSSKERPPLLTKGPVDSAFLFGSRHGQPLSSLDAGRRSTYKICRPSPFCETSSFMCNKNLQSLILRELDVVCHSFILFHTSESPLMCLGFAAFATVQSQSNTEVLTSSQKLSSPVRGFSSLLKSTGDEIDVTHTAKEDETCKIAGMSSQKSPLPHPENSETKSTSILCYKRNIHKVTEEGGKKTQNRSEGRENNLASHISTNGTSGDTKNIGSSSNQSFLEPKSKYSELKLNKAIPVVPFQARASSRFIFDMPFLQAQLNQMNPAGKNDIPLVSRDNMERSLYSQEVIIRWTGK